MLRKCTLCITLTEGAYSANDWLIEWAIRDIAEQKACLQVKGVDVVVQLHSSSAMESPPAPHILKRLAPILHSIWWSSPAATAEDAYKQAFSAEHVTALQTAASPLQHLAISDWNVQPFLAQYRSCSIKVVGSLLNLTELSISYQDYLDLAPLQHLSHLQELALRAKHLNHAVHCHEVLKSSRCHLQTVRL